MNIKPGHAVFIWSYTGIGVPRGLKIQCGDAGHIMTQPDGDVVTVLLTPDEVRELLKQATTEVATWDKL
jgi:uncharacterized protein YabE (DUF348 family)